MPLVNPNAAGIDIGDTIHAVAVLVDRDKVYVKSFDAMTCDFEEIIKWLLYCKIDLIARESTGIYWKPLFTMLIRAGFKVYLVNSK